MKFGQEFKASLIEDGFPAHWVQSAVDYRQLKKVINKVAAELRGLGLDSATLAQLLPETSTDTSGRRGSGIASFEYEFDGDQTVFHPKLTIFIENGLPVGASLSPATRKHLQNLVLRQQGQSPIRDNTDQVAGSATDFCDTSIYPDIQQIDIPLKFDSQFFKTLQQEVHVLEALQAGEQNALGNEIISLSTEVTELSKPSRFSKTDMNRWRELFALYLEANVFFSTHELDHGRRDSITAAKQLQWFQNEVLKRKLTNSFKLAASHNALERFVSINKQLLLNIKFQEINSKAVSKILKKFDKRTQLGAVRTLPKMIQPGSVMPETMAKAVCAQLTQDLISKIPQIDDYSCPICFSINWRPIRMKCSHVLCISCAVTLQQKRTKYCPFCRGNVILEADSSNIDSELENYLEKHFPKEVRAKRIEVETERGREQFGPSYKHPSERQCSVM